jgi:hypothetical protein
MANGTREDRLVEFRSLKGALIEAFGEEAATTIYYNVLHEYGAQHSTDFRSLQKANAAAGELWHRLNQASGSRQ